MQTIKIEINKAVIESFHVAIKDDVPEVEVSIALYTKNGQRITTYSISTNAWNEQNKFNLPTSLIRPILDIMKDLEVEATRHCRKGQLSIGA